ncbi:MAG: YdjY domain-containing protein [Planctomycetota bacterium]
MMKLRENKVDTVTLGQAARLLCLFASLAGCFLAGPVAADEPKWSELAGELPADFTRLGKNVDVWMSPKRKLVVVDGKVCLREGQLEMFACPRKSKEHESVVAVNSDAKTVHAALLAIGATTGSPVKFDPQFTPPTGTKVDIMLLWNDPAGKPQQRPAQDWVRHVRTKKQLETSWVFAGSGFWTDESSGQRHYQADAGDLVCVSNFPTATLDLPVASSQDNADLQFEAFTDRIPAKGTTVRLVFQPRIVAAAPPATKESAPSKENKSKP